jgi:hypothetical protein
MAPDEAGAARDEHVAGAERARFVRAGIEGRQAEEVGVDPRVGNWVRHLSSNLHRANLPTQLHRRHRADLERKSIERARAFGPFDQRRVTADAERGLQFCAPSHIGYQSA